MPRSAAATSESLGAPGVLAPAVTTYARAAMFAAAFFYALSYTVISPTLPFFARELERRSTLLAAAAVGSPEETGDTTWLHSGVAYGMVMSGYGIAKVVSAPLIGHLSDRCGRRATLLWTLVGGSVCAAVSGTCQSLPSLLATRFVSGRHSLPPTPPTPTRHYLPCVICAQAASARTAPCWWRISRTRRRAPPTLPFC